MHTRKLSSSPSLPTMVPDTQATLPALPPHIASHRSKTTEQVLAELNSTPLFMTQLVENEETEALKALVYDGNPVEVAGNFKEQGNECYRVGRWVDARSFYGKGIDVLLAEDNKPDKATGTDAVEAGGDAESGDIREARDRVLEACYVNRAACQLELKNYRSCTLDCAAVLRINGRNLKALYRSSKAWLSLGKIAEADDACARGLALEPDNEALNDLAKEIIRRNEGATTKKGKEAYMEERKKREALTLKAALKARGIRIRRTANPPEVEDARIQLLPDPVDPTSEVHFPAVLLYPLALKSDFIKAFGERDSLGSHLAYVLPLSWDTTGEYHRKGVDGYMETKTGGLLKVGRNVNLLKVLSAGSVEVVDELVRIFVVPRAKADAWIQEFKMKKAAERNLV